MASRTDSQAFLLGLLQKEGNATCADCNSPVVEWASANIGIFVCCECAGIHRHLPSARIKSLHLDHWEREQLEMMESMGNESAKGKYEQMVPPFYRRPQPNDVNILKQQWITAKYGRMEFMDPDRQSSYNCNEKIGYLMKKGREEKKFHPRKFVLSRVDNTLVYYQKKDIIKAVINLDDINAVFVPHKSGKEKNMLQITYIMDGSTRSLFVYSEDSKDIVDWYYAIRAAKLERRKIAFPDKEDSELTEDLTTDFLMEGWLSKMGPRDEPYRRRWFTLDRRKFMYYEGQMDPYAKGELFIGHKDGGYSAFSGVPEGKQGSGHAFTLRTPDRMFYLSAESREDMEKWIEKLVKVTETLLTPQDTKIAACLVPKKSFTLVEKMMK